ncbi:MAG: hypothetical protein ACFFBD_07050 [Candidatus Hodarchaeota archaeon]
MFGSKKYRKIFEWHIHGKIKVSKEEESFLQELWFDTLKYFDSKLTKLQNEGKIRLEVIEQILKIFKFDKFGVPKSQITELELIFSQEAELFQEGKMESEIKKGEEREESPFEQEIVEKPDSPDKIETEFPMPHFLSVENQDSFSRSNNLYPTTIETKMDPSNISIKIPPPQEVKNEDEVDRMSGLAILRNQMLNELIKIREILNTNVSSSQEPDSHFRGRKREKENIGNY